MRQTAVKNSLFIASLFLLLLSPARVHAGAGTWSLTSPDGRCAVSVFLESGDLNYQASLAGKIFIQKSPLGLRRDDQDFEHGLVFDN
ncbi:MAG TPA: glycoside hydrolase family 97 N-terminal domain-containing protein, partial [Verrucomicrobiae bacterium]|nr:glycoside hydrolase family 97 N-terminal domain-containing protein [Verrucomicrobiae bacterium]